MLKQIGTWKLRWKIFTIGLVLLIAVVTLTDAQDKKPPEKPTQTIEARQAKVEPLQQKDIVTDDTVAGDIVEVMDSDVPVGAFMMRSTKESPYDYYPPNLIEFLGVYEGTCGDHAIRFSTSRKCVFEGDPGYELLPGEPCIIRDDIVMERVNRKNALYKTSNTSAYLVCFEVRIPPTQLHPDNQPDYPSLVGKLTPLNDGRVLIEFERYCDEQRKDTPVHEALKVMIGQVVRDPSGISLVIPKNEIWEEVRIKKTEDEIPRRSGPQPMSAGLPEVLAVPAGSLPLPQDSQDKIYHVIIYKVQSSIDPAVVQDLIKSQVSENARVALDIKTNSFICTGNEDDHKKLQLLFDTLNKIPIPKPEPVYQYQVPQQVFAFPETVQGDRMMIYRLLYTSAREIEKQLQELFPTIIINIETATNSLLISAPPSEFEAIREKVRELDVKENTKSIKVYQLKNTGAGKTAEQIGELMPTIKIAHDARTNALIVTGTPAEHKIIEKLLEGMDREAAPANGIPSVYQQPIAPNPYSRSPQRQVPADPIAGKYLAIRDSDGETGSETENGNATRFGLELTADGNQPITGGFYRIVQYSGGLPGDGYEDGMTRTLGTATLQGGTLVIEWDLEHDGTSYKPIERYGRDTGRIIRDGDNVLLLLLPNATNKPIIATKVGEYTITN